MLLLDKSPCLQKNLAQKGRKFCHDARMRLAWSGVLLVLISSSVAAEENLATDPPPEAARPNVILIMTDDQGYGDVGAHGNTMIQTPCIDALYHESLHLTDFHVCPTCSPTRAAMMTGRYSIRGGVWHTVDGRALLNPQAITIAETFVAGGYRTGLFGKWHLGDNYPLRAEDQGFQEVVYLGGGGITQAPDYWGNDYFDDTYKHNGEWEEQEGYCTDVFFDKALEFIDTCRQEEAPFFCYIPTNAPHKPFNVDNKYTSIYTDQGVERELAKFYGMITNIDENVGRLRETIKEWGISENTILIFCTDNGSAMGETPGNAVWVPYSAGMRGRKGSEYDAGHRVPFFIHWPAGDLTDARDVDTLCAHIDVLPTLADLCNIPTLNRDALDGLSLVPKIYGTAEDWEDRTLFTESQRVDVPEKWRRSAAMTERWRLLTGGLLYDIQADPGQTTDVAEQFPHIVSQLEADYDAWWESLEEARNNTVRIVIGAAEENPSSLCCHDWHHSGGQWNSRTMARNPRRNGYWEVEVAEAGTYQFSLRLRPAYVESAWPAGTARLKIGETEWTQPVAEGEQTILFEIELEAGPARIQTWVSKENGPTLGAYFTDVERID